MSKLKNFIKKHPYLYQYLYELDVKKKELQLNDCNLAKRIKRIKKLYKKHIGRELNLNNPEAYTEKLQYRKIYDNNPLYSLLSDKYAVREWVKERVGEDKLIPLLGHWANYKDIDFDALPSEFVLKTNNASGTNVIVKDKNEIDHKLLNRKFSFWLKMKFWNITGYELHYATIKPLIIAEKYVSVKGEGDLKDYKFLCFDGKVNYIWVDTGRYHNHKRTVFDRNWNIQEWQQLYYEKDFEVEKPDNLDEMIAVAERLADGFDHVRVDLYDCEGKILFGEMTFTNASGFQPIVPDQYDYVLGKLWNLKK